MAFVQNLNHYSPSIVSLQKAKKQMRFDDPAAAHLEDDLIEAYIDAAIVKAENFINSEISEKKFRITGKDFADVLTFSKQIIRSVDAFTYRKKDGSVETVPSTDYSLQTTDEYQTSVVFNEDYELPEIMLFNPAAITLDVTVGYPNKKVPKDIIVAILLIASSYNEGRQDTVKDKKTASENLLQSYRRY
jgi:hypothetical protein|tara:strand:+ start:248 stop:814 length:567 start_codon:yes stop_codon:yes gene_type:complete